MSTYKDIIINCLNNNKVIPPRIRLNIYNKILKRIIIIDKNNETKYICIELKSILIDDYNIYIIQIFIIKIYMANMYIKIIKYIFLNLIEI